MDRPSTSGKEKAGSSRRALASCMPTYVYMHFVRRTPRIIRSRRGKGKPLIGLVGSPRVKVYGTTDRERCIASRYTEPRIEDDAATEAGCRWRSTRLLRGHDQSSEPGSMCATTRSGWTGSRDGAPAPTDWCEACQSFARAYAAPDVARFRLAPIIH